MDTHTDTELSLAPPGAGLPRLELLIAKRVFAAEYRKATFKNVIADLEAEKEKICSLVSSHDPEVCAQQVLIKRLRGMEDSSRNWSAYMTADHLRIVNESIVAIIGTLKSGRTLPGEASTAAVKPSPDAGAEAIDLFRESCESLSNVINPDDFSQPQAFHYAHPWFGTLDAAQWLFMGAFHMRLHRKQIERIFSTLSE